MSTIVYRILGSFVLLCFLSPIVGKTQKITYSEPDRNELKQTNFDILGKYGSNFLVYKGNRNTHFISVYDDDMKVKENIPLSFIPAKVIETDFLYFNNYSYLFYQYQQKNVIYLMVVKIGPDGKNITSPVELDTTIIGYNAGKRVYSVLSSEDKTKLIVYKINNRNENNLIFKTMLMDAGLGALHASQLMLPMADNDFLTDFHLDNDGHFIFGKGLRKGPSDNITKFLLVEKPANKDFFVFQDLKFETSINLDEVKLKIDNYNNRYLFTAFYYLGRKPNIEGIANAVFDKKTKVWGIKNLIPLDQDLRMDARGDNNVKAAFNDYFIRQIIIRRDGGFLVNAESIYQTTKGGNSFNRWDMMSPYGGGFNSGFGGWGMVNPYGMPYRFGGMSSNTTRYHADNIVAMAFDTNGKITLSNTIRKNQYDDDNESMVSYQTINTGDALHFLYNDYEKRDVVLTYQTLNSDGKISRNPTMKNLDQGFSFIPRYAKQVAARTVIIPALYRNYLCFAKIDY